MKTLLITDNSRVPQPLHDIVAKGSTSLESHRASDVDARTISTAGPDRVVFWQSAGAQEIGGLAEALTKSNPREASTSIVFVAGQGSTAPAALQPDQVFEWPRDEDRLKMAFLTGA